MFGYGLDSQAETVRNRHTLSEEVLETEGESIFGDIRPCRPARCFFAAGLVRRERGLVHSSAVRDHLRHSPSDHVGESRSHEEKRK